MATKKTKRPKKAKKTAKKAARTVAGKSAAQLRMAKRAVGLSEKARLEVARLLEQQRAKAISGEQLETGLEEVVDNLKRMLNHILASL